MPLNLAFSVAQPLRWKDGKFLEQATISSMRLQAETEHAMPMLSRGWCCTVLHAPRRPWGGSRVGAHMICQGLLIFEADLSAYIYRDLHNLACGTSYLWRVNACQVVEGNFPSPYTVHRTVVDAGSRVPHGQVSRPLTNLRRASFLPVRLCALDRQALMLHRSLERLSSCPNAAVSPARPVYQTQESKPQKATQPEGGL